jgi:uncharacterized protein YeaO (DUF488 family)
MSGRESCKVQSASLWSRGEEEDEAGGRPNTWASTSAPSDEFIRRQLMQ